MSAISRPVPAFSFKTKGLLLGASLFAFATAAAAQEAPAGTADAGGDETIVVTGSRVITDGSKAPTPITVVATETLQQTTPSNIPDALNKLPVFSGGQRPRNPGNGDSNRGGNTLALRGFGPQRTLVLVDGHRVAPSNANGTVSIDTIPQELVKRVDVVTGGVSAVYGSDAVAGVVNFVLDREFTGMKINGNFGVSTYGDGLSYKLSGAFGANVLGGRGHVMVSAEHYHVDKVDNFDRPYGPGVYVLTGDGSAGKPFTVTMNTRRADSAFGGKVQSCVSPCSALGQQFASNGVLGPFNPGTTTGTGNQNMGGDGAYSIYSTALVEFQTDTLFGRFDYDLTDDVNFWVQGSWSRSQSYGLHFPAKITPVNGTPTLSNSTAGVFFKNNAFLSPAAQAALGNNGLSNNSNVFSLGTYIVNLGPERTVGAQTSSRYWNVMTGLSGKLGSFAWELYYGHGDNRLRVDNLNNSNYQKQFAAMDAVLDGNSQVQCYAKVQNIPGYQDCVPLNAFGPTAITPQMFDYFTGTTTFWMTNVMDNVGASISGDLVEGWAGPIKGALSFETRWNSYKVENNTGPQALVNCGTGANALRICNPTLAGWAQPILSPVAASSNVWEIAGEFQIPLLRDLSFAKDLSLNLAGRYTDYSTSGAVQTWKAGAVWEVVDGLRLRGAASLDIRAPTLDDLFRPASSQVTGYTDLHTKDSRTIFLSSSGNPNLVPEKARTFTFGAVVQPRAIPGLTLSIDYFRTRLNNAITVISPTQTAVQQLCENSNGTHPYCALMIRPNPFSDTDKATNFPTSIVSINDNAAYNLIKGVDFEASYVRGPWSFRLFGTYQPVNDVQGVAGADVSRNVGPKVRMSAFAGYNGEHIKIGLQDSWQSSYSLQAIPSKPANYVDPTISAFNTLDLSIEGKIAVGGSTISPYMSIQNLFNAQPDILPASGSIGLNYPVPANTDIMGRYFTLGVKARF